MSVLCAQCGRDVTRTDKFCGFCGRPVPENAFPSDAPLPAPPEHVDGGFPQDGAPVPPGETSYGAEPGGPTGSVHVGQPVQVSAGPWVPAGGSRLTPGGPHDGAPMAPPLPMADGGDPAGAAAAAFAAQQQTAAAPAESGYAPTAFEPGFRGQPKPRPEEPQPGWEHGLFDCCGGGKKMALYTLLCPSGAVARVNVMLQKDAGTRKKDPKTGMMQPCGWKDCIGCCLLSFICGHRLTLINPGHGLNACMTAKRVGARTNVGRKSVVDFMLGCFVCTSCCFEIQLRRQLDAFNLPYPKDNPDF
eukprot:TRINITY_DN48589_c0_g1_i1.p1 TRINITY_DN48589_c0_g1~~TRINITY_DN48589_c0_g1_i1.p1  ORF type:complete len:355 (+),score=24.20 TRINITY_DN48589_c0_g1_i1:161-1066(+)